MAGIRGRLRLGRGGRRDNSETRPDLAETTTGELDTFNDFANEIIKRFTALDIKESYRSVYIDITAEEDYIDSKGVAGTKTTTITAAKRNCSPAWSEETPPSPTPSLQTNAASGSSSSMPSLESIPEEIQENQHPNTTQVRNRFLRFTDIYKPGPFNTVPRSPLTPRHVNGNTENRHVRSHESTV